MRRWNWSKRSLHLRTENSLKTFFFAQNEMCSRYCRNISAHSSTDNSWWWWRWKLSIKNAHADSRIFQLITYHRAYQREWEIFFHCVFCRVLKCHFIIVIQRHTSEDYHEQSYAMLFSALLYFNWSTSDMYTLSEEFKLEWFSWFKSQKNFEAYS